MKIPGYKHLVEDILPDINNYIHDINRYVQFSYGNLSNVTDDLSFVFTVVEYNLGKREKKLEVRLNDMLQTRRLELKHILSWYLWTKYTKSGHEICTETYKDCHYLLPGEPPTDPNPDAATRMLEELDGRFITLFHRVKKFDGIGMTEESIPSKALNPIEVASWPLKVK